MTGGKSGYPAHWLGWGMVRLLIVLLALAIPAIGPRVAHADTFTYTGTLTSEGDCQYSVDVDTDAKTFSGTITCSGAHLSFAAEGVYKGSAATVSDFMVNVDGNDFKVGINKTYTLPVNLEDVGQQANGIKKLVDLVNGDVISQAPGLSTALKVLKWGGADGAITDGFQKALDAYDQACSAAASPGPICQFSQNPGPAEAESSAGTNSQAQVCPGLQPSKTYLIVCIPTLLVGKLDLGDTTLVIAPGGVLLSLPLGSSLSHPTTPLITTNGSVLVTAGGIFGAGLEIDAKKGVGVAGGVIALLGPLTVQGGSLQVGKLDLSQLSPLPSLSGLPNLAGLPSSVTVKARVFASAISAQVKTATIAAGSVVSVNGGGSPGGATQDWGGSYGGLGGSTATGPTMEAAGTPGSAVGNPFAPASPGVSGGDDGASQPGSAGGGYVVISATDTLALNGDLRANGDDPTAEPENGHGGGSGGGILLQVGTLTGGGTIAADGGGIPLGGTDDLGGAGGGGRIALLYTHNTFTGPVHAYGGRDLTVSHFISRYMDFTGGAGTVFMRAAAEPKDGGTLLIAGDSATRWPPPGDTPVLDTWSSPRRTLIVEGGARALLVNGAYKSIILRDGGIITLPPGKQTLTQAADSGTSTLPPGPRTMTLTADSLSVDATSRIDANARGDAGGPVNGPNGKGKTPGTRASDHSHGGSHGGLGGGQPDDYNTMDWRGVVADDLLTGDAYGNPLDPSLPGAGGASANDNTTTGATGGGVLRITVGTLRLDGRLAANGQPNLLPTPDYPVTENEFGSGGGGGAVNLRVKTLSGSGRIEADGGDTCLLQQNTLTSHTACGEDASEGGGGGGRIAVRYRDKNSWTGKANAYGGYNQEALKDKPRAFQVGRAGPGTVFWLANSDPADGGTLVIDGGGAVHDRRAATPLPASVNGGHRTLILTGGAVAYGQTVKVANLQVVGGAVLTTSPGTQRLDITADTVTVDAASRIDLTGRGAAGAANDANAPANGMGKSPAGRGSTLAAGGSHGGTGGGVQHGVPGSPYDSAANPTLPGAGGGGKPGDSAGSPGGGVLVITTRTLTLDGRLAANGLATEGPTTNDLTEHGFAGAGAGGSINLHLGGWQGSGTVAADGGDACLPPRMTINQSGGCGNDGWGAGGGGRIAIVYQNNGGWTGTAHASGGANRTMTGANARAAHGGAGTVVTRKGA